MRSARRSSSLAVLGLAAAFHPIAASAQETATEESSAQEAPATGASAQETATAESSAQEATAAGSSAQDTPAVESRPASLQRSYSLAVDTAEHPLRPPDTSSPRATLSSFLEYVNRAHRVLMEAHRRNTETPGLATAEPIQHLGRHAEELFARGTYTLDLSQVPAVRREDVGYEGTILLKEILDRITLPPFERIPGSDPSEQEEGQAGIPAIERWRIPETDIVIARVEDGPRKGEYLFSPRTVARLNTFYHRVKDLPYRSDRYVSRDFLDFYDATPGRLLPPKWGGWLPAWSTSLFFDQTIWQWGALIVSLALGALVVWGLYRVIRPLRPGRSPSQRRWRWVVFSLVVAAAAVFLTYVLVEQVNLTGSVLVAVRYTLTSIAVLSSAAAAFFSGAALAETIIASPKIDPEGVQASYMRVVFGLAGFLAAATIVLVGLSRFGIALLPLLTGVGIGGLALALAARPTIENIIGSFMIFADKPFQVGQRVKVMGQNGTVESIGLRSTRIRLLTGEQTSIPNEKVAAAEVENIGRRPYIRRMFNVTLTYDTPPEKISRAVEILREILAVPAEPKAEPGDALEGAGDTAGAPGDTAGAPGEAVEPVTWGGAGERQPHRNEAINRVLFPPRVYFNELNADSLNIVVFYWYHPPLYWHFLDHAHWVNLQIMERFNAEGIEFALPTQTLHIAGDGERHLGDLEPPRGTAENAEVPGSA